MTIQLGEEISKNTVLQARNKYLENNQELLNRSLEDK